MLFLSRACFDVIPVAKERLRIQPPTVTASTGSYSSPILNSQENVPVVDVNQALTTWHSRLELPCSISDATVMFSNFGRLIG